MKKFKLIFLLILFVVWLVFGVIVLDKRDIKEMNQNNTITLIFMEKMYVQGQVDALNGNIKVKQVGMHKWVFTESPWKDADKSICDTIIVSE